MVVGSLLFGCSGYYKVFDVDINFISKGNSRPFLENVVHAFFQTRIYTFVHEMGHALTAQSFGMKPHVDIYLNPISTDGTLGYTRLQKIDMISSDARSLIAAAGPVSCALLSSAVLLTVQSLNVYLPKGVSYFLKGGATLSLIKELGDCAESVILDNGGDFAQIAQENKVHLLLASASLVAACVPGFLSLRD